MDDIIPDLDLVNTCLIRVLSRTGIPFIFLDKTTEIISYYRRLNNFKDN